MAEINLTQQDADNLIAMPKVRTDDEERAFSNRQHSLIVPLFSQDKRESFILDIHSGQINLSKITFQNRFRQVIVLVRLDIGGPPHRNPDGVEMQCPHLHVYREGFGDKWALPIPVNKFYDLNDHWTTLQDFMKYCTIIEPPFFKKGLFS